MPKPFRPSVKLTENDVTDESVYRQRRQLLKSMGFIGASALLSSSATADWFWEDDDKKKQVLKPLSFSESSEFSTDEKLTPFEKATSYNNFYEFGTDKSDPADHAGELVTDPWTLKVDGLVEKPITLDAAALTSKFTLKAIFPWRNQSDWSTILRG